MAERTSAPAFQGTPPVLRNDIAGQFCGQWQPHAAHVWQTPPTYGTTTLVSQYQCAGFSGYHPAPPAVPSDGAGETRGGR